MKVDRVVGGIAEFIRRALEKNGIEHVVGAVNERAVVIGIKFESIKKVVDQEVAGTRVEVRMKNGVLFLVYPERVDEVDIENINKRILKRFAKMGIDARGYILDDGKSVVSIQLVSIVEAILYSAIDVARQQISDKMRLIRVAVGHDDQWGYIVIYRRGEQVKKAVKPEEIEDLAV